RGRGRPGTAPPHPAPTPPAPARPPAGTPPRSTVLGGGVGVGHHDRPRRPLAHDHAGLAPAAAALPLPPGPAQHAPDGVLAHPRPPPPPRYRTRRQHWRRPCQPTH